MSICGRCCEGAYVGIIQYMYQGAATAPASAPAPAPAPVFAALSPVCGTCTCTCTCTCGPSSTSFRLPQPLCRRTDRCCTGIRPGHLGKKQCPVAKGMVLPGSITGPGTPKMYPAAMQHPVHYFWASEHVIMMNAARCCPSSSRLWQNDKW